jgi:thymidylate synthase
MLIVAGTLDDLMRSVFRRLLDHGRPIHPSRGPARELTAVVLHLTNPRARLSRSESRGHVFSALGELLWYLAKSRDLGFITYYIPLYADSFDDGETHPPAVERHNLTRCNAVQAREPGSGRRRL